MVDCECAKEPSESKENQDCYDIEHCQHDSLSLGVLLSVLVALRGVTNHNADDSQEDEEIEDENGSNGSEEGSVEYNSVANKTAAEKRRSNNKWRDLERFKSFDLQFIMSHKVTVEPNWYHHSRDWQH